MRRLLVTVIPVMLLVSMAGLRAVDLRRTRADLIRLADARAANLADMTSTYLGETFASTDAALRQLAIQSQRIGGPDAPDSKWLPILQVARAGLPVGAISVTDANGIITHSAQPAIVGSSRRDDSTFRALMQTTEDVLIAGPPFRTISGSLTGARLIIPIGRKLFDASGRVIGTVVVSFIPGVPRDFLRSVDVGARGTVWVFHPDGVLLYQEPSTTDRAGDTVVDHPVFMAARRNGTGLLHAPVGTDGVVKLTAYRTRDNPPLITAVSLDEQEVLSNWRQETTRVGLFFGLLAGLIVVVQLLLVREMGARSVALAREQNARQEAEHANAVKDQFLMTLSHELRTPLTAIRGWARMLAIGAVDEGRRIKAIDAIERNALAQERLIEDLLDVSRIVGGNLSMNVQTVQIAKVAHLALETVRPTAEAKGVQLQSTIDEEAGAVSGDPERLQQVVWNLLSNAVKFTPAGGRVLLDVHARRGSEIAIVVTDTGVGISTEFLPRAFERFQQADATTTRSHGGLGLGLSIVRSLVELHGGRVSVRSDGIGHGATFEVVLPAAQPATATQPSIGALRSEEA
jgi:signal transduction histidine kinase